MDRVKNHISFAVWFVGLSYLALWPIAAAWPMLSSGLHWAGAAAASWVSARLLWLLLRRLIRAALPPAWWWRALRLSIAARRRPRSEPPASPPRWVPPRREFGLRRAPR